MLILNQFYVIGNGTLSSGVGPDLVRKNRRRNIYRARAPRSWFGQL